MKSRSIAPWLAAAIVFAAAPSLAQTNAPSSNPNAEGTAQTGQAAGGAGQTKIDYLTKLDANTWRASALIGKDVYGANDQDIGEIDEVLVNHNGQVVGLVIDVGGFLGIGESQVAVPLQAVQFLGQPASASSPGTSGSTGKTGTTGSARNTGNQGSADKRGADNLPDRIVLNVTKEQLQSAPKFEPNRNR